MEPTVNPRLPVLNQPRSGPTYAVWELTLRCNQACRFCGTRAGRPRPDELDTAGALEVVRQLAELGVREVAMHGGETYLRHDWLELVRAIRDRGMSPTMVTGGRGLAWELAQAAKQAGITAVSVSIDGLSETHDWLRGIEGSHDSAREALRHLERAGVMVGANTQVNRRNLRELPALFDELRQHPLYGWQVQLMVPMGRAAEEESLWLEPYDLLELMPMLAELRRPADEAGIALWPGDNVGYFGPFEHVLRHQRVPEGHSSGCGGGILAVGIEANGDIKGCSAMSSEGFVAGNVRTRSLRELWESAPELKLARCFQPDTLWGFCRDCYYGEVCKAGCIWTSATILGRFGNAPYCHHRALEHLARGERESLVRVEAAPGKLRDRGRFEIKTEPAPAEWLARMRQLNQTTHPC
jgi:radical SAM protein with 4Fe4S-binding SPASM domain